MMKHELVSIASVAALSLAGCVVTDVGNPQNGPEGGWTPTEGEEKAEVEFALTGYEDVEADADTFVVFEEAVISVVDLSLVEEGACDRSVDEDVPYVTGPVVVDLLEDPVESVIQTHLSPGVYCRVSMNFAPLPPDVLGEDVPDELTAATLRIDGTLDGEPFALFADLPITLALLGDPSFDVVSGSQRLFVGFDLHAWFRGIDLGELAGPDGKIVIDARTSPDAYGELMTSVAGSSHLARDKNNDGMLNSEERSDPIGHADSAPVERSQEDMADNAGQIPNRGN